MTTKQQNITMSPAQSDWYGKNFKTCRQGAQIGAMSYFHHLNDHPVVSMFQDPDQAHDIMLSSWKAIWRHSLLGIKGIFTEPELSLILDIHNGHAVSWMSYGGHMVYQQVSDAIALDGMDKKWSVEGDKLLMKLKHLSPIQEFCFEIFATGFWYGKDQAKGMDDYIKALL